MGLAVRHKKIQKIDAILESLLQQKKWQHGLLEARLKLIWTDLVGPEIAARAQPTKIYRGRLVIHCDHDVWRTELVYLEPELLKRIAEGMGEGVIKEIYLK
jgi:predicted nucleic acid-binding Zn ribbon protein